MRAPAKLNLLIMLAFAVATAQPTQMEYAPAAVKQAVSRAIALLQTSAAGWFKKQSCVSCHHQILPMMALRRAREHGVPVDETLAADQLRSSLKTWKRVEGVQGTFDGGLPGDGINELLAVHDAGLSPNDTTAVLARFIARRQMPDGRWMVPDGRPPQNYSEITWTATGLRALQSYLPASMAAERFRRVSLAADWLRKQNARSTEEHVFRLLGLSWANSTKEHADRACGTLEAEQRADGGWPQLPSLPSDAYSTGQALVALHEAGGMPVTHETYRRGVRFLIRSQIPDGSWLVKTRILHPAEVSPPYFESGFPHGKNQFISSAGTAWAAMALSLALPRVRPYGETRAELTGAPLVPWAKTVLFGSAADVERLLKSGMDPNSSDQDGTTALMMAAPDADKVRLLLDAGARVNEKAKSRVTALMVATAYRAGADTVRLLIQKGAEVEPAPPQPRYNLSPVFLAMLAGDLETVKLLVEHKADVNRKAILFGFYQTSAFSQIVWQGDAPTADYLAEKMSAAELGEAAIIAAHANRPGVLRNVRAFRRHVNYADRHGMTPLLYAASIDYGTTEMVEALLQAGADIKARTREGATALALARRYGHRAIATVLERAGAVE